MYEYDVYLKKGSQFAIKNTYDLVVVSKSMNVKNISYKIKDNLVTTGDERAL